MGNLMKIFMTLFRNRSGNSGMSSMSNLMSLMGSKNKSTANQLMKEGMEYVDDGSGV